jgi:hypothetical protein
LRLTRPKGTREHLVPSDGAPDRSYSQTCSPGNSLGWFRMDTPELRTHSELPACTSVNRYMSQSSDPKVPGSRPGRPTRKYRVRPWALPPLRELPDSGSASSRLGSPRTPDRGKDSGIGRSAQAESSCTLSVSTCCCMAMILPSRNVQTCAICTTAGFPVERCFHE